MTSLTRRDISPTDAERAAADAFIFGYPLVLMGRMRGGSPANAFAHEPAPSACTLASTAWLDLEAEPVVLSVPDCHGQYYVLSLIDMWTSVFASIGPRTTGTGAGRYAIAGPHWNGGALPTGVHSITAPTTILRIAGQTQPHRPVGGTPSALPNAFRLDPLSVSTRARGDPAHAAHEPVPAPPLAPAEQLEAMDATTYFAELAGLLDRNPPRLADRAVVERMRRRGVLPLPGAPAVEDSSLRALHERGMQRGLARVRSAAATLRESPIGRWTVRYGSGPYGTDYLRRATAARAGQFTTSAADEIPANVSTDADGRPLTGEHRYHLRFGADEPPPARGFWSLASGRSTIGDADGLTVGADGSLTIYIQPERPDGREQRSNWLPTPRDAFDLALRLFWPRSDVLEHRWSPPPVTRVG